MRRLLAALGALVLGVAASAGAAGDRAPSVLDPLPFDHAQHRPELVRIGLACTDCHAFAAPLPEDAVEAPRPVARAVCHGCHQTTVPGGDAPTACATCHPVRAELLPGSHGPDWDTGHAAPARAPRATCQDCHDRAVCIDCHASRGALARSPHPPAFRSVHGVEARLDPASCDGCHTGDSCADCHRDGGAW